MNRAYITLIAAFIRKYQEESMAIGSIIGSTTYDIKNRLDTLTKEKLEPLINQMFIEGIAASNQIVSKDIAALSKRLDIPMKFDKGVLETINGSSIFTGFYDKNYQDLYTKREIDLLKRKILTAKYSNATDREMAAMIRPLINTTKDRALMVARAETQRLEGAAVDIFFKKEEVKAEYDKVYHYKDSESRDSHIYSARYDAGNGPGVADDDGNFTAQDGTKFPYPPNPVSPYNCRCSIQLIKKK